MNSLPTTYFDETYSYVMPKASDKYWIHDTEAFIKVFKGFDNNAQ